MKDGDVLGFELIDKRLTGKPEIKGMALGSDSIEQLEKLKANMLYESDDGIRVDQDSNSLENLLTQDRDDQPRKPKKKRQYSQLDLDGADREEDSDKNSAIRSSQNFWEDIEPKMNMNAKLLDFSNKFDDPSLDFLGDLGSPDGDNLSIEKKLSSVSPGLSTKMSLKKEAELAQKKEQLAQLKKQEANVSLKKKEKKVKEKKPRMIEYKEMERKLGDI